jgi:hypothetical protein
MDLLRRGRRTREIADALKISERAVTAQITRLMATFGVTNRTGLIAAAMTASGQTGVTAPNNRELERYEDAPFMVAVTTGPRHVFRFVNRMWERVMHLRAKDVIGRTVREVFPDSPRASYAARQRDFREGRPTSGNDWHLTWTSADQRSREADFRYIYQPLRDRAGQVEGVLLIAAEEPKRAPK